MIEKFRQFFTLGEERTIKAKKQIFYSFGIKGISILVVLIYVPVLLNYLDSERYGVWLALSSIIQWISYFDLGLGNGLRNNLASSLAIKNHALSKRLISTTYALLGLIFGSLIILIVIVFPFIDWSNILNTNIIPEKELLMVALIAATMICVQFILNVIKVILLADQRPALSNIIDPINQIIALGIIVLLLKATDIRSLVLLCTIISLSMVVVLFLASVYLYKKEYKIFKPSIKSIDFKLTRSILGLGSRFFIIQISGLIIYSTSNIIIIQLCGPADVTTFQIAYRYFTIGIILFGVVITPFWSAVTEAFAVEDYKWLKNILSKLTKLSLVFSAGVVLMLLLNQWAFKIWIGDKVIVPWLLSIVFTIYAILTIILTPFSNFINGLGKLKLTTYVTILKSILFFPLAIFLTKTFGIAGIVLTLCLIQIIGLLMEPLQVNMILNKKASGIWNK
jgi:O-antigen/teichoic acid export membrane protein